MPGEQFVNDYNEEMLLSWEANVDLQYIGEDSMVLDRYITTYITKAEKHSTDEIWENINQEKGLYSKLWTYALKLFKSRECGIYEACDKLLGIKMHEFSRQVFWVNTDVKNERSRLLKSRKEVENLPDESEQIYHTNLLDDYYPNRPEEHDEMSLFYFASWYELKPKACQDTKAHNNCFQLGNSYGFMHCQSKERIIQTANINCINSQKTEEYFHQLLILFLPWRNENELYLGCDTYFEAYKLALEYNLFDANTMQNFQMRKKKTDQAISRAKEIIAQTDEFRRTDLD